MLSAREYSLPPSFNEIVSALSDYLKRDTFEKEIVAEYTFKIQSNIMTYSGPNVLVKGVQTRKVLDNR